ncbi:MAG TPA: hypothetical protein VF950_24635, partial [Planctomycetota bacterium]
ILYTSSMAQGSSHDCTKLPVALLGGPIAGGRILDYTGKPNRKMCSLFLSMMDRFGVREKSFGDSTERLAEI